MKIVVDAMGGDYAPAVVIEGVVDAVHELDVQIVLVGREDEIIKHLQRYTYEKNLIEIVHAPEVVEMHDPASSSIRKKRNSSISVGVTLLKNPGYDAFISAGNTAAVVAASTFLLGMMPGVERPGIGLVFPTLQGPAFMIDVGANTAPKSQHLVEYGKMARVYARDVLGIETPVVGLLNIGEEATKGSDFVKETHKMMSEAIPHFIGNIEANEIFTGKVNCVICDGFVGNVVIKVSEALMEAASSLLRREIKKSPLALLGAFLMKSRLHHIKKFADYSEYGSAPLLGINGIVMISHGRSSAKAVKNAIRATYREVQHNILDNMLKEVGADHRTEERVAS